VTSPGPDDTTARLATAAAATGANRPQLAVSLANSDLSTQDIKAVGGFVDALQLSVARRLAANSGATANFTAEEKNRLAGIGEQVADEDEEPDSRSWMEKATDWVAGAVSNTGSKLIHNPVSGAILDGFDWLGDAAHMPFRLASDAFDHSNDDEIDQQMEAQGYDPDSRTSYLAFMFEQGESQYHDLSDTRDAFGDENVDLALEMLSDPEEFSEKFQSMDPNSPELQALAQRMESAEFQDALDSVDRKHISPGRDIARLLLPAGDPTKSGTFTEDGKAFTILSGTLDAAYTWFTDPTLILGKANKVIKAADALGRDMSLTEKLLSNLPYQAGRRGGLTDMTDQAGIEALLRVDEATGQAVTSVGKGWQRYLKDAEDLRAADEAGDEAARAGIYSVMTERYGVLMQMLPEINGWKVMRADDPAAFDALTNRDLVRKGDAITDLATLREHLISTNGLMRLNNGEAARRAIIMPGRLSWRAERTAAAEAKTLLTRRNKADKVARWIDYSKPTEFVPNEAEQKLLDEALDPEAVRAGLAQRNLLLKSSITSARATRAKMERVVRRFRTQLPSVTRLDLADEGGARTVEQIARMYLNKGDAAKLASSYALAGSLAERRAITRGILQQSFHASGLSRSEAGQAFMRRFIDDQEYLERQKYGYADTSKIQTDRGFVQAALYPDQISRTVVLPSMREMNYLATKFAVGGWVNRTGAGHLRAISQSDGMDAVIGRIKLGWITTAAGGLRNAIDEMANFAAYGMGKDVLAGRVAFTQATKDARQLRREASVERRKMIRTLGRTEADDRIAFQLGQGLKSYEDSKLMVERAAKAEQAVANVPAMLRQRVRNAAARIDEAKEVRFRALDEFEQGKAAGLPEEQLAVLRERAQWSQDELTRAEASIKKHHKNEDKAGEIQAQIADKFDAKGIPSVKDAEADLVASKAELEQAQRLQVAISHKLPYAFRWVADNVNDVFVGVVLGKAMSVLGKDWAITGERVKWAKELVDREAGVTFRDGIFQANHADTALVNASDDAAMDYHRAGLMARKYSFRSTGWGEVETDGGAGLNAWAKTLQLRFADPNSPAHSWVQTVNAMLPPTTKEIVDDGMKLYRIHEKGAAALPSERPHGLYLSHETDGFESPHAANYEDQATDELRFRTDAKPGSPEVLSPEPLKINVAGLRGNQRMEVDADAGISALKSLVSDEDWTRYVLEARKGKEHFAEYLRGSEGQAPTPKQVEFSELRSGQKILVRKTGDEKFVDDYADVRDADPYEIGEAGSWHYNNAYDGELMKWEEAHGREATDQADFDEIHYNALERIRRGDDGPFDPTNDPTAAQKIRTARGTKAPTPLTGTYASDAKVLDRGVETEVREIRGYDHSVVDNPKGKGKLDVYTIHLGEGDKVVITRPTSKKSGGWPYIVDDAKPGTAGEYPDVEWDKYYDSYEQLMALGALKAKERGYKAIWHEDGQMPEFSEYVALTDDALRAERPAETVARRVTHDEWTGIMQAARDSVLNSLDNPELRHFVDSAETFQWYKGTKIAKGDEEMLRLAKEDYADRVSADLAQALGPDGTINRDLLTELAEGRVPDRSWLAGIDPDARPSHAIGQLWAPYNPAQQPGQINQGVTGMMVKAYDKMVTDQINALSRNPLVTALYMRARENTKGYVKNLVDEGFDPQVADDIGRRMAAQHAEVEALKHIDNPYVSSQFSMIARNQFAFVRAQEDWLRRWGRTIKDNPEIIRKAQLLIHGGESTGFLEKDDTGELHFVYPNSPLLLSIFGGFFGVMNQPNGARLPMHKELSSQLTFLNPSLDNPLGLSGTPLLSLPWRAIGHFLGPDNALFSSSVDKVINGELGAGREWWETMLPSWANRIISGVIPTEDMGSKFGAAIMSTMANQEAAGMYDDPKYQTPEGQAELLNSLQVGIHNDMLALAIFGFFAPAAPTYEGGPIAEPDWSSHIEGLRSLKDEARQLFARLPYEEAKAWWMAVHPNESILAPTGQGSRTSVGAKSASAPATIAAASYLEKNTEFFANYGGKGGIAAYFIPQGKAGTKNGEYSDVAYRAQLELGIRDYKSLDEYFTDVVTARGYAQYFALKDDYDAKKTRAASSPQLSDKVDAEWQAQRDQLMAANPLLAQRLAESAVDNARTGATMQSLYRLVNDTSPSTIKALGRNRAGVQAMLDAKERYDKGAEQLGDRRGSAANRRRNQNKTAYDTEIAQLAEQFPGLADLARGVFRPTS
jgi:hypothetical protein